MSGELVAILDGSEIGRVIQDDRGRLSKLLRRREFVGGHSTASSSGTTAGTYTITVAGSAGTGSAATHTITLTLVVH